MFFNYSHQIQIRVRYSETDQMGFCYYGHYAAYFEMGRVEALRSLGIVYKELEDAGILLPVQNMNISYKSPARYDDLLSLKTQIIALGNCAIDFSYTLANQKNETITVGETRLIFVSKSTLKPIRVPESILQILSPYEIEQP